MALQRTVESLYEALAGGDTATAAAAMAADVEWWFHGPPRCHHMMRVLTGEASHRDFRFAPRRVAEVGGRWVVAEGWEGEQDYWVHVWAIEGGVITQFREYFNTSVTVHDLGLPEAVGWTLVWQSKPWGRASRSLPGLVLAI